MTAIDIFKLKFVCWFVYFVLTSEIHVRVDENARQTFLIMMPSKSFHHVLFLKPQRINHNVLSANRPILQPSGLLLVEGAIRTYILRVPLKQNLCTLLFLLLINPCRYTNKGYKTHKMTQL